VAWVPKVLALVSPRWRPPSTCEACGGAFTCGATLGGCWCREVEVSAGTRAELRERYSRCLCRPCLEAAEAASRAKQT
jgi:hypothetical protein